MNLTVNQAGTLALLCGAVCGFVFLIVYSFLAKWWESREGWYLWVSSLIFAEVLTYNFAVVMDWFDLPEPAIRDWVRLVIYGQVFIVMAWRGLLLLQAQADGLRAQKQARVKQDSQIGEY